jgi:hypothetical protein
MVSRLLKKPIVVGMADRKEAGSVSRQKDAEGYCVLTNDNESICLRASPRILFRSLLDPPGARSLIHRRQQ